MFLEHLSGRLGEKVVGDLIKQMAVGTGRSLYSPVDAIEHVTTPGVVSAWRLFCESFMDGQIYQGRPLFPTPDMIAGMRGDHYIWENENDPGPTFNWDAPDLSARVYLINIKDPKWKQGTTLNFSLSDPAGEAEMIIYKRKSAGTGTSQLTKLAAAKAAYQLANAEQLIANGEGLIVMVANGRAVSPYSGSTRLSLGVKVSSAAQQNFPNVYVDLYLWGSWQNVYDDGTTNTSSLSGQHLELNNTYPPLFPQVFARLVWTGDSFAGDSGQVTYQDRSDFGQITQQITISGSLDAQHSRLAAITFRDRYYKVLAVQGCPVNTLEIVKQVTITNAPLVPGRSMYFSLTGTTAAANTQLTWTETENGLCFTPQHSRKGTWMAGTVPANAYASVVFGGGP